MAWHDELAVLLDRLWAGGGVADAGDWSLAWDHGAAHFVLSRHHDGTCSLFTRANLLDYAHREVAHFAHRHWVIDPESVA